ncbi:MAG: dihydrodipicolinate synthase family protein [Akkermansiaceae bacterium]
MNTDKLKGMVAPIVVPFNTRGDIDEEALRTEVKFLLNSGIDGISSGGSTGEGAMLSDAELKRCVEIIQEENQGKIPVFAGIIRNSTRDVIRAALDAKDAGTDVLLITPAYYHGASETGNLEFFREITKAVQMPVLIYNVVKTNIITPEQFERMRSDEWMIGVKQVDPLVMADFAASSNGTYLVYGACDSMLYGTYVSGACGAFSALVTIAPTHCKRQWEAFLRGDQATAMAIQAKLTPLVKTYLSPPYPGKVKALINLQGRTGGLPRHPILPVEEGPLLDSMRKALAFALSD